MEPRLYLGRLIGLSVGINILNSCHVRLCLFAWTRGAKIARKALPQAVTGHVVFQDPSPEVHVVLDTKQVDLLQVGQRPPGRNVNLHDADGILAGDGKRVAGTLDEQHAGDQMGIQVMLATAGHDSPGDPCPLHPGYARVAAKEILDGIDCWIGDRHEEPYDVV